MPSLIKVAGPYSVSDTSGFAATPQPAKAIAKARQTKIPGKVANLFMITLLRVSSCSGD
jgi:hypothetical protein